MTADKQPMQADGQGTERDATDDNAELASHRGAEARAGESGGGAYPNRHTGKDGSPDGPDRFLGRGGQTDHAYHGHGQLGEQTFEDNPNAPSRQR